MNYEAALEYLYGLRQFGLKLGLEGTRKLAALAGNPHHQLRFLHVAGTNGKGSTCAFLESICRSAGLRTGLYTSPHLVSFTERFQVNRVPISSADVVAKTTQVRDLIARMDSAQPPTFFEAVTVMALLHFIESGCEIVIWETGLGGRLDATNIVTPLGSVITSIGLDHQQWLGNTIPEIAAEKAGIFKPTVPAFTSAEDPLALGVFRAAAAKAGSRLTELKPGEEELVLGPLQPSLAGSFQRRNAALAVMVARHFQSTLGLSETAISAGLSSTVWPGRLQQLTWKGNPLWLDGAHNEDGARALVNALSALPTPSTGRVLIFGALEDKDWGKIWMLLEPSFHRTILVKVNSDRAIAPERMEATCRALRPGAQIESQPSLAAALARLSDKDTAVVTGSLYLVGEALELMKAMPHAGAGVEQGRSDWRPVAPGSKTG